MTYRITNRKSLKTSEWLATAALSERNQIQPPPREALRLQEFDPAANINTAMAVQQVRDAFERKAEELGGNPTRDERVTTDGPIAVAVHKAFDGLTLREASDPDFWAYVACFGCTQYVRWRWDTNKPSALWTRYAGNIRRNAVSRLWWWAEITCDQSKPIEDPLRYEITRNVSNRQSLMLWYVDCAFSGNPLIAHRLAALQQDRALNDSAQKDLCRTVNRLARVICLDSIAGDLQSDALCQRAHSISQILRA